MLLFYLKIFLPKKHLYDRAQFLVQSSMMEADSSPQSSLKWVVTFHYPDAVHNLLQALQV